jgi:hypothetical protein
VVVAWVEVSAEVNAEGKKRRQWHITRSLGVSRQNANQGRGLNENTDLW